MSDFSKLDALQLEHLRIIADRTAVALEACGFDALIVHSGRQHPAFLDDQRYPFRANPHFSWWVPRQDLPDCLLRIEPGRKPLLLFHSPADFWHLPPAMPSGVWTSRFDIRPVRDRAEILAALPRPDSRTAFVGEAFGEAGDLSPATANPPALLRWLHEQRVRKTDYEIACLREASRLGAAGHWAARQAQLSGASEFGIHQAFLAGCAQREQELPYQAIVARGQHGATLHYQSLDRDAPHSPTSLLIDAGAGFRGYGSDITRSWPARQDDEFGALVAGLDAMQQNLCRKVRAGESWQDLHLQAHLGISSLLREADVLRIPPEAAVEEGISSVFLPHGLGHLLGLQVHDVAGFHPTPDGAPIPPPKGHEWLRLTRPLVEGMVVTMEPGLYFIDLLLDRLRTGHHAAAVNWELVDKLLPHGGIRIEDNLVVGLQGSENLTRDAMRQSLA
jgi:Xaa-Pro dipeptidase